MSVVYYDDDEMSRVRALMDARRTQLGDERDQHDARRARVAECLAANQGSASQTAQHPNAAENIWYDWGLGEVAANCQGGAGLVDQILADSRRDVEGLISLQPGVTARGVEQHWGNIDAAFTTAVAGYRRIQEEFTPGAMLNMLINPESVLGGFDASLQYLDAVGAELSTFSMYLAQLSADAIAIVDLVGQPFPDAITLAADNTATWLRTDGVGMAMAAPGVAATVGAFLGSHYQISHTLDYLSLSGSAIDNKVTKSTNLGFVHMANTAESTVGAVNGGIGFSGDPTNWLLGAAVTATAWSGTNTSVVGNQWFGVTNEGEVDVLSGKGQAGLSYSDGKYEFGAQIGGTLASVQDDLGVNVAGLNVGVNGSIGLSAQLGIEIGNKTEIKLPFISFGFDIGPAISAG